MHLTDDHLIDPPGLGSVDDRCERCLHFYDQDGRCPFCMTEHMKRSARIARAVFERVPPEPDMDEDDPDYGF